MRYDPHLFSSIRELISTDPPGRWDQRIALLPLFRVLSEKIEIRQAAYEVLSSRDVVLEPLERPLPVTGLVGFLENTGRVYLGGGGEYRLKESRDGGVAPDGIALAKWGGRKITVAVLRRGKAL